MLQAAHALAQQGFAIFPCRWKSKSPATAHGLLDATKDPEVIAAWWRRDPSYNIAIATGTISGIFVGDIDGVDAEAELRKLEAAHGILPPTIEAITSRGRHVYFRMPPGIDIRNSASKVALGIDIRGNGGYVLAPPSIHPSGRPYCWSVDTARAPADAPPWLIALLTAPAAAPAPPSGNGSHHNGSSNGNGYAHAALAREIDAVASAQVGQRNHTLNRASFSLHQLVASGALSESEVRASLFEAATASGLTRDDGAGSVRATIASGARAGLQQPRAVPERSERPQIKPEATMNAERVASDSRVDISENNNSDVGSAILTEAVQLDDFYAYMPEHKYICAPSRELWPAPSVNARLPPIINPNGEPIKAATWLDANAAVEQMTWAPGEPMLVKDRLVSDGGFIARPGWRVFNLYRPPTIVPRAGDVTPWLDLINKAFPAEAEHTLLWLAHRVQYPHIKINHALFLGGKPGIGKDTILEPVKEAVGPWNFADVSPKQVLGRFNGFLKSVILRINEARDLGEFDRYAFFDHMKQIIAAPPAVLRVDEKNLHEYYIFNLTGAIITSNHKTDGIYLPADDRRHFVAWSRLSKDDFAEDYWRKLYGWYGNGGNEAVAEYLHSRDLSGFDPKAPPPKTSAFWEIANANRAPEDAELMDVLDDLQQPDVVTLDEVASRASRLQPSFGEWLRDAKTNARRIPHRFEDCGYVAVRNPNDTEGRWKISGRRHTIYGKIGLTERERLDAAFRLAGTR